MLGELKEAAITNILHSQVIGRLACSNGKEPYITPVTYAYDGDFIYGQTNEGKKLDILRKNPKVCFEVDMITDMRNWQSVVIYGKFEELEGAEAKKLREILFDRVFPLSTSSTIHPHEHETKTKVDDSTRVKRVLYRIRIQEATGRFEKQ
jgi:nitroimidazol reductase NimA-like FMN-containing flavoprotein (pyridoxamine 5'-phosphate oxidase superfamily)